MKKIFLTLAVFVMALCANAQTNQYFWYNGNLMMGNPIAPIDSVTFGEGEPADTLHILLPRTIIKTIEVHDTTYIIVHDTVCPNLFPDTSGIEISIDSAITICKSLSINAKTAELYKLSGVVSRNNTNPISVPSLYTYINFDLSDGTGTISCYNISNINNLPFSKNADVPRVGSKVTVIGVLNNYQKTGSTNTPVPELTDGYIVRIDSMVAPPPFPGCPEPAEGQISASDAVTKALALADKAVSTDAYDILGVVTEVLNFSSGKATYIISSDGKQFFEIYRGYGMNSETFPSRDYIAPNDTVVVHAKLTNYSGTPETSGTAYLVSTTNPN